MPKTAEQKDATVEQQLTEQATQSVQQQGITVNSDMLQLIAAAVASAVREANRDPDKEAAKERQEADREMVRREEQQRLTNIKARQDACTHLDPYDHYSFAGQKNCMGEFSFVCQQCFRPFKPSDPDYNHYLRYVKWDRLGNARA